MVSSKVITEEANFKIGNLDSWVQFLYEKHQIGDNYSPNVRLYHYHEYIELLFFTKGSGTVFVNNDEYEFEKNTFVIINSKKAHTLEFKEYSEYYCIKVLPRILYDEEKGFMDFKYAMPFISDKTDKYSFHENEYDLSKIHNLFAKINSEWDNMRIGYELVIRASILNIFSHIFRMWEKSGVGLSDKELPPPMRKAILYMSENYRDVNEKEIADMCGFSYNYLSFLFKKTVGKSFRDYLNVIRINAAQRLLLTTDKSITEIAQETGFSTTSHFIHMFKKIKNVTPAKFRQNCK